MKILHTSDWHLGRTLHGENLHEYQREFQDFLLAKIRETGAHALVIAGDIYDRSVPPVEAVELLHESLAALAEETTVILTPGNHDSAVRLGFGAKLMRPGIHILADVEGIEHPVSVADEHGEVLFFGLPFLDPDLARYSLAPKGGDPLPRTHEDVTVQAMDRVRAKLETLGHPRSVVLAHTFVAGGDGSDSERDLSVGGVASVPGGVFAGVDYVALGHLHGCQNMSALVPGERPAAWYSGSPLAFSFSERHHTKAVLLVEMDSSGLVEVERIPTPVRRRLIELDGSLKEILDSAPNYSEDWIHAIVREETRPAHLQQILSAALPHLLFTEFRSTRDTESSAAPVVTREASPAEVISEFFDYVTGAEPSAVQRDTIEQVLADARARADFTESHAQRKAS
ncbi:exonuclease SbcCD subunit D [Dermabacter sp. HMSC08H10]|uniref:exonuclease SbcCD subunit D n=1 Tax=Dermabacter sp. HMSC08H10 TaxID=1581144 RepID=UPI0008A3BC33|nr:exonuclease SbcCD subunit D [Dermabacter sp. HMSC08H10]OFT20238.1 exonuclease sbcCD subunit D [Dermabacter sp. HMSC08H10]